VSYEDLEQDTDLPVAAQASSTPVQSLDVTFEIEGEFLNGEL
jgi:hypothetical protein